VVVPLDANVELIAPVPLLSVAAKNVNAPKESN
jgi:hypothetical protein